MSIGADISARTRAYPLIGIVTAVRNRRAWSVGFVQRIAQQDYPFFKLYIIDSASTDGTPEAIRALNLEAVETLAAPASAYWTAATNIGVRRALADGCSYILTINDDAIVADDFLSILVGASQDVGVRIVGAVISYASEPARLWGVGAYNNFASGAFVQTGLANLPEEALQKVPRSLRGLSDARYLCGNGALFHRSVYEEIGLYDERNTPHYHADTELTMRAEAAGIARYVALDARLYNRFTESGDGAFASKNERFFSLRSANYIRPLLYILDRYCDREDRALALVRYLARYFSGASSRDLSKLLRAIALITAPKKQRIAVRDFALPSDVDLLLAQDIDLLLEMSPRGFVLGAYSRLMRRACSDQELLSYQTAVAENGGTHVELLREFIGSEEYRKCAGSPTADFARALLGESVPTLTLKQAALISWRARHARNPTAREFAASLAAQPTPTAAQVGAPIVYFNVDVPCMAITDPRARTGVHRYVISILEALRADLRVTIRIFHSHELATQFEALLSERPDYRPLAADLSAAVASAGVAFYPYFPVGARATALAHLPQALTICDLFPLLHPEWFSEEAIVRFRRQLHGLTGVDHVFCISQATRSDLHRTFPALKAQSSVAYLAADAAAPPTKQVNGLARAVKRAISGPYFVCVGTIEPRKNLRNVITAFARLGSQAGNLRMIVIGCQGWNIEADALLGSEGLDGRRIEFLGRVPDAQLWEYYKGAICAVFPSLGEGFGLPILEAFRCGTPVVTSNVTSMPEIATKGAILVDPTDPDEIARGILLLARDRSLRNRLAEEGRARSREFSWRRCADEHVRVFLNLAARGAAASSQAGEAVGQWRADPVDRA